MSASTNNDEAVKTPWRINEWFPDLSQNTQTTLQSYFALVVKHNKTLSLVSPKTVPVADALHFADCILGSQIVLEDSPGIRKIYDLGSGNGFPGIVFGILNPEIEVVLIESDLRKVEFLKLVAATLGISNVQVQHTMIESLAADSVNFAIVRGFGNISKTILLARKIMPKGGVLYHMKGEQWGLEITEIPTQLCSIFYPALVREYVLPSTQVRFGVVKTTKN